MGLPVSTIAGDSGFDWETNLNASLDIIDQHDHSPGRGVPISAGGININADLPFNGNNGTSFRSVRFTPQVSVLTLPADVGCLSVVGNELYYNDVTGGHQIQITLNGSVNAGSGSISGLPSGTASAAFSAGTFIWQSATSTAANMDAGSYIFRNSSANSKGLTLSPPAAMASNFGLTLPSLPGSTLPLTLDASGNIAASTITGSQIAAATITGSNIANTTINVQNMGARSQVVGGTPAVGDIAYSPSSGPGFATASTSYVDVTGVTLTLPVSASGRPVTVFLTSDGTGLGSIAADSGGISAFAIVKDGTAIYETVVGAGPISLPPGLFCMAFQTASTTSTYKLQIKSFGGHSASVGNVQLVAYEI